jgi:ferredoxin
VIGYVPHYPRGIWESRDMKVVADYDLCEANAVCMEQAPEVFKVDDEDNLHILIENPGEELRQKVEAAVRLCPRQALSITED